MPRWRLACDGCSYSAWIGSGQEGMDAWCEACQEGERLAAGATRGACSACGRALTLDEPRFEEIFGELHQLAAVLAAWDGDPDPLGELLPERPRYRSDLSPPAAEAHDDDAAREALAALSAGAFAAARERLEPLAAARDDARLWRALAIACERRGDTDAAEVALRRTGAAAPSDLVALQHGALLARRGQLSDAAELFEHAGDRPEAKWNRAAVRLALAVESRADLPERPVLEQSRRDAGPPSSYWIDHTVGRLLWELLVDRLKDWGVRPIATVLADAEREFEFETFWDRALMLEGYVRLGLAEPAARIAAALAGELAQRFLQEPGLAGSSSAGIATVFDAALYAIAQGRPGEACETIGGLLRRQDLSHYRVPCRRCAQGSIGVEEVEDLDDEAPLGEGTPTPRIASEGRA